MRKTLILCTSILLCCVLAEALVCYTCRKFKKDGRCIHGSRTCVAKSGQQCKTVTSFLNDIRGFSQKGCTKATDECGTSKFSKKLGTVTTTCCNDRDYCNK